MADISIANLPAFLGASIGATALLPFVDPADTSESPLGTTKRLTAQQMWGQLPIDVSINGALTVTGGIKVNGSAGQFALGNVGGVLRLDSHDPAGLQIITPGGGYGNLSAGYLFLASGLQLADGQQVEWGGTADAITVNPAGVMRFYIGNANVMTLAAGTLAITPGVVIGPDPGGAGALRVGGATHILGPEVIGTDPGGAELLRVGSARIGALAVNGTLNVGGLATLSGGLTLGGIATAGGFTATTSATAAMALNTGPTEFTLLSGQSLALATNGNGHGLFYLGINTLGCLAAYHNTVMTIIWQTGGFSTTPGQAGTINLWYGSGPMVENMIGFDSTVHVINMAA